MRRFDHAPFFSMQKSEYTIPFYIKVEFYICSFRYLIFLQNDLSKAAAGERTRWLTDPNR